MLVEGLGKNQPVKSPSEAIYLSRVTAEIVRMTDAERARQSPRLRGVAEAQVVDPKPLLSGSSLRIVGFF